MKWRGLPICHHIYISSIFTQIFNNFSMLISTGIVQGSIAKIILPIDILYLGLYPFQITIACCTPDASTNRMVNRTVLYSKDAPFCFTRFGVINQSFPILARRVTVRARLAYEHIHFSHSILFHS